MRQCYEISTKMFRGALSGQENEMQKVRFMTFLSFVENGIFAGCLSCAHLSVSYHEVLCSRRC